MANETNNLSARAGIDTTDFKTGIAAMNRDLRVLESGFKASAAAIGDWTRSEAGLESRIKTLNSEIDIQTRKVEATRAEYQRLATEQGENSRAAEDMQIKLNRETERLNAMNLELNQSTASLEGMRGGTAAAGQGVEQLTVQVSILDGALAGLKLVIRDVTLAAKGLAVVLKGELAVALGVLKFGVGAILGLGAAGLIATAVIGGLTLSAAKNADALDELSTKVGISVSRLQELNFIGKVVGTDLESVATAQARLIRAMTAAQAPTSAQAKAFKELGVSVVDAQGNLRDSDVVFAETIDALGKVTNETEADALALQIFGRSALELNPLIRLGAEGMADLTGKAHLFGAVVSDETIKALGDLNDKFDEVKLGFQGVGSSILVAFAPFFGGLLDQVLGDLVELARIVQGSGGNFDKLAAGLSGLFQKIIQDFAAQAPQFVQFGLGIIKSIVQAIIASLPQLLEAGLAILHSLVVFIIDNLPLLAQTADELLTTLADAVLGQLPIIVNTALKIIETLITAIVDALPTLLPELASTGLNILNRILSAIQEALPKLLPIAVQIIETLIKFLVANLTTLIQVGLPLIQQLIAAILPLLPQLVEAALQILIALADGLTENLPVLIPVIAEVLNEIARILFEYAPLLLQAGGQLLIAIINGFTQALPILLTPAGQNTITELFKALIQVGAQLLPQLGYALLLMIGTGIAAALPVMAESFKSSFLGQFAQILVDIRASILDFGKNIVLGIWQGILNERATFLAQITKFFTDMVNSVKKALGIESPSKVFAEMGKFTAQGFGIGFQDAFEDIRRQMQGAVNGFQPAFAAAGSVSNSTQNNESYAFYAPVIVQDTSSEGLGATLKGRRF